MNTSAISIATICWARDTDEETLLRTALTQLAGLNIPVYITDGGSSEEFVKFLKNFPTFTVLKPPTKGLWPQAKTSLEAAHQSGSPYILYTEPDKLEFFRDFLPYFFKKASPKENTGIILASRSISGFQTFPEFQQKTETAINYCCAEILRKPIDYTYGPFLLNRRIIPYLNIIEEDMGWGWRTLAFGLANRLKLQVEFIEGDFSCPPNQQKDTPTERIYRMRQLTQNIQGLVLSTTININ